MIALLDALKSEPVSFAPDQPEAHEDMTALREIAEHYRQQLDAAKEREAKQLDRESAVLGECETLRGQLARMSAERDRILAENIELNRRMQQMECGG